MIDLHEGVLELFAEAAERGNVFEAELGSAVCLRRDSFLSLGLSRAALADEKRRVREYTRNLPENVEARAERRRLALERRRAYARKYMQPKRRFEWKQLSFFFKYTLRSDTKTQPFVDSYTHAWIGARSMLRANDNHRGSQRRGNAADSL